MSNVIDEISKADALFTAGIVTEDEFTQLKARLIAGPTQVLPSPSSSGTSEMFAPLVQGMASFFAAAATTTQTPTRVAKPSFKSIVTGEATSMDADLTAEEFTAGC